MKKTKIIATYGPSIGSYDKLKEAIMAGVNIVRINFTHATLESRKSAYDLVMQLNKELGTHVGIMHDLKGPDIRTGNLEDEEVELIDGASFYLSIREVLTTKEHATINYPQAIKELSVDDKILLDDGMIILQVTETEDGGVKCQVLRGGILGSFKGVNIPGVDTNIPFISEDDHNDIVYACEHDCDFLALSFVESKEDIMAAKEILKEYGKENEIQIISKVESKKAIENLDEIVEYSDGIMVARGDLGVEMPMAEIPVLTKIMIQKCREQGKYSIVATEMLASMVKSPRPTRAEVSDISNAILDGTDAIMLSEETTIGKYPIDAIKFMKDTAKTSEGYYDYQNSFDSYVESNITEAIARSVVESTLSLPVKVVVVPTLSGRSAKNLSNDKPKSFILAAVTSEKVARGLSCNWGVYPVITERYNSTDDIIEDAKKLAQEFMSLNKNDIIIVTGGFPNNVEKRSTNFMKIEQI